MRIPSIQTASAIVGVVIAAAPIPVFAQQVAFSLVSGVPALNVHGLVLLALSVGVAAFLLMRKRQKITRLMTFGMLT